MVHRGVLRTRPIHAHFGHEGGHERPGKVRRPPGDPVSHPKSHPKFIPPPITNLENLSLGLDVILPEEAKSAVDTDLLVFHAVGDTGGINGDDVQIAISDAMDQQISDAQHKKNQFRPSIII